MGITIRLERAADYRETEELTRDAFWDVYKPGCDEHFILHRLRASPAFVPELALVACEDERIAGSIVYSLAKVVDGKGAAIEALCLGPVSVAPGERKKGIGSQLINESLAKAEDLGHRGVFLFGNPAYYGRFGFLDAKTYGVTTSSGENFDAFMGLELYRDSLKGVSGKLVCDSAFEVDKEALELYDKSFPPREKHKTDSQIFKE